ncbi:hypothetical protein PSHT_12716 [Puccinia striiformis]|uniref:Uncharacterized protein n=1 Tax=Puccinia striiformis TaxID=27350 RepID=A0A2S4UV20_9BASI|nr:hypothetical protein PSHT_12716 [Puccinia striiformis]
MTNELGKKLIAMSTLDHHQLRPSAASHQSHHPCLDEHYHPRSTHNPPEWTVRVTIIHSDHRTGKLSGMMQADGLFNNLNKTQDQHTSSEAKLSSTTMIITAWEGETINLKKSAHELWTNQSEDEENDFKIRDFDTSRSNSTKRTNSIFGKTSHSNDLIYWSKTKAFIHFKSIDNIFDTLSNDADFVENLNDQFVLMRWKETNFVNCDSTQSGLSIQGFYYVCLEKRTGIIEAFYYDPASLPYQKLSLKPIGTNGYGFGSMTIL